MKALLFFLLLGGIADGEPVTLERRQAMNLFVSLLRIEPGLTAENTMLASDNLNALRPVAETYEKGLVRAERDIALLPQGDERVAKEIALREKMEALGEQPVTIELQRMDISADEIKGAKIKPEFLAPLRQFLRKK